MEASARHARTTPGDKAPDEVVQLYHALLCAHPDDLLGTIASLVLVDGKELIRSILSTLRSIPDCDPADIDALAIRFLPLASGPDDPLRTPDGIVTAARRALDIIERTPPGSEAFKKIMDELALNLGPEATPRPTSPAKTSGTRRRRAR